MDNCLFQPPFTKKAKCTKCGRVLGFDAKQHPSRNCSSPRGLGDRLAGMLARFGIRPWKGCGCKRRQEKLNRFGRWLASYRKSIPPTPGAE